MREYKLIIPGKPVGKQRPRMFNPKDKYGKPVMKHGQPVMIPMTPEKTRSFETAIREIAWNAKIQMLERCRLEVIICIPYRVKEYKTKPDVILEPGMRPDGDNVFKAVADALQGIAFKNDKHILEGLHRYQFIPPTEQIHTEVIITEVDWQDYRKR